MSKLDPGPDVPTLADRPLRQALARGDDNEVLRHLEPTVRRAARGLHAPGLTPDDLHQHARLGVINALRTYKGDPRDLRHLVGWCALIARNAAVDAVRAAHVDRDSPHRTAVALGDQDDHEARPPAWAAPDHLDPARIVEGRDELREVVVLMGRLPERQARALVLVDVEGRSYLEVASMLGIAPNTLSVELSRARRGLGIEPRTPTVELASARRRRDGRDEQRREAA